MLLLFLLRAHSSHQHQFIGLLLNLQTFCHMIGHTSWNVCLHAIFILNKTNAVAPRGWVQCYCQGQKALVNIIPNIDKPTKTSISEKSHHIWVYLRSSERLKHDIIGLLHLVCKMEKEHHGSHSTHELDAEEWQLCFALIIKTLQMVAFQSTSQ